ncbi:hypothetical protein MPLSOD_260095 [Mesorhizobium sp. SOD10]|nr:hypothetical protein MPLSOD_260095 [Mesorhizobium sp. SOD10]
MNNYRFRLFATAQILCGFRQSQLSGAELPAPAADVARAAVKLVGHRHRLIRLVGTTLAR